MKAFVIMPFAEEFYHIFENIIKPAFEKEGVTAFRADGSENYGQNSIIRDIVHGLATSDIIIAELTGTNANVMYELGIAHGLQKPTVILAQDINHVPFDLRSYRIIIYTTEYRNVEKLKTTLTGVAKELNSGSFSFGNPVSDYIPDDYKSEKNSPTQSSITSNADSKEYGMWDFAVLSENAFSELLEIITRITQMTHDLTSVLNTKTSEATRIQAERKVGTAVKMYQIANEISNQISVFGRGIETETTNFKDKWSEAYRGILGVLKTGQILSKNDVDAATQFKVIILQLQKNLSEAVNGIKPMRGVLPKLKTVSKDFNESIQHTDLALDSLIEEFLRSESDCNRILNLIDEIVEKHSSE